MILADKIMELRKKNNWSQEELAEQLGVSRQAISKWEGALAVPDMKHIIRMADIFSVTTDYLVRDEMILEPKEMMGSDSFVEHKVTMEEASEFLNFRNKFALQMALGVMSCILCSIPLLFFMNASEVNLIRLSEEQAAGLGLIILFIFVGIGVTMFIFGNFAQEKYKYLITDCFDTIYGVDGMVKERRERFRSHYTLMMGVGIILCVLSSIPIFIAMMIWGSDAQAMIYAVIILLMIIAVGIFMVVRVNLIWEGFQILLEEGEFSRKNKEFEKKYDWLTGAYWLTVTAIFLLIGFTTGRWNMSWIIWPVASVSYGAFTSVIKGISKRG